MSICFASDHPPAHPEIVCFACHARVRSISVSSLFTSEERDGGWKLRFGEWAELGEPKLSFDVLACTACRHVELRVPPERRT